MNTDVRQAGEDVLRRLEEAWNAADGAAFAAPFTDDADFVAIRGDHHRTREAIAAGHQAIFDTIYRGSTIHYSLTHARPLTDDVILVHASQTMDAPSGPLAGAHGATATLVLVRAPDGWKVTAFHNTLVQGQPSGPPPASRQP
ncbi:MAG TPA: SgcJ/EcaC family oxidoreductase [Longimicrobium sp.]